MNTSFYLTCILLYVKRIREHTRQKWYIPVFSLDRGIYWPWKMYYKHCIKSFRIWSFFGLYFPVFGMNTEIYRLNLRIQSECGNMRIRKPPNTTFFIAPYVCITRWLLCWHYFAVFTVSSGKNPHVLLVSVQLTLNSDKKTSKTRWTNYHFRKW